MDKERDVCPRVPQGRRTREPLTPTSTAPSAAPVLPNPYQFHSNPSLRGSHSLLSSGVERHGNNKPKVRVNSFRPKTESTGDTLNKASVGNPKSPGHGRKDLKRRGRDVPDATFEVKLDEFPELSGIFVNQTDPHFQRHSWRLPTQNLEESSDMAWKGNKNAPPTKCNFLQSDVNTSRNAIAQESPSVPNSLPSSWANIASQSPKKLAVKESPKDNTQVDEVIEHEEEGHTSKKKRKKKKKKSKGADDEDTETRLDESLPSQDPPKFEDEEEFPGLTPFTGADKWNRSRSANLCNDENQRQGIQHHPKDQKKDHTLNAKSSWDTSKTVKGEKVSGKKSKVPVQLDIGNMLAALEKKKSQKPKQDTKPLTLSVGGGLPMVSKQLPVQKKPVIQDKVAHNPLDSTSPLVKKGKQREVPKAKKPTPLKKVILKEREERKQRRLLEERGELSESKSVHAEEGAEEENTQTSAADETFSPAEEPCDQIEVIDEEEEKEEDETSCQELSTSPPTIITQVDKPKIHSRKFREYCTQMLSKDVDECVTSLLKELVRFQDRLYQKDPMKARMKRRIVMGLREVLKHLKLRKVKCVIISPNCERSQAKGGLDEAVHTIIDTCRHQEVPFIFALSRKALGRCVNKAVPVSLVGVFNYDGAQDIYHKMIELSSEARKAYEEMLLSLEQSETSADDEQPFVSEQTETSPNCSLSEEPEYIKLWKKLLEKDSNHTYGNFEEQLSSMCLDSECTEQSDVGTS